MLFPCYSHFHTLTIHRPTHSNGFSLLSKTKIMLFLSQMCQLGPRGHSDRHRLQMATAPRTRLTFGQRDSTIHWFLPPVLANCHNSQSLKQWPNSSTLERAQVWQLLRSTQITPIVGNYSRLVCSFLMERALGFYMIQIYLPSILIVVISWVSFWLSREATPARVALGVTTVLTMTTLMTTTNVRLKTS